MSINSLPIGESTTVTANSLATLEGQSLHNIDEQIEFFKKQGNEAAPNVRLWENTRELFLKKTQRQN